MKAAGVDLGQMLEQRGEDLVRGACEPLRGREQIGVRKFRQATRWRDLQRGDAIEDELGIGVHESRYTSEFRARRPPAACVSPGKRERC